MLLSLLVVSDSPKLCILASSIPIQPLASFPLAPQISLVQKLEVEPQTDVEELEKHDEPYQDALHLSQRPTVVLQEVRRMMWWQDEIVR